MASTASQSDGLPMPRRIWAIGAISFGSALLIIDGTIANVALPTIARDLGIGGGGAVVAVVTLYQLVLVMCLLPFTGLGDRLGHRNMYQLGQLIFLIASATALLVQNFAQLLIVRGFQALGAAMALSVATAMLRAIYPAKSLGGGLGINSVISATSAAIAPTLGGFLVHHLDWRWVFFAAAPPAVLSLLIGRALPDPEIRSHRFDWIGGVWSAATFGAVIGGAELAIHGAAIPGSILALAGIASGWRFLRRELGQERPILPVDLLRRSAIGLSSLASVLSFVASAALIIALPFRFETAMGFAPQEVGLLLLPFPLTMLIVSPLAGILSDRLNPSILGASGMAIAAVALVLVGFLQNDATPLDICWRLSLCALGFGLFFSPNARLVISLSPQDRTASAGGLLATSRLLGQTLGASALGLLLATGMGLSAAPFLFAAALTVCAGLCSLVRLRTH